MVVSEIKSYYPEENVIQQKKTEHFSTFKLGFMAYTLISQIENLFGKEFPEYGDQYRNTIC